MEFRKTLFAGILLYAAWGAAYVAVPLYLDSLGIGFGSMGILFGIAGLLTGAAMIGVGAYADVLGRKTFASIFTLLNSAAYASYALFSSFSPLALVRGMSDFFYTASFNMLAARVIDASHRDRLGRNFGYFFGFASIVSAPAIALVGVLIAGQGFGPAFIAIALIAAAAFFITLTFAKERMAKEKVELSLAVLRDRDALVYTVFNAVRGFSFAVIVFAEPLFFKYKLGFGNELIALVMAGSWLFFGLSNVALGPFVDRFGAKLSFLVGSLADGFCWIAMVLVPDKTLAVLLYLLGSAAMGAPVCASFRMVSLIPKKEDIARDTALFGYAFGAASILGLFAAGWLAELSLSLNFVVRALALVLAALIGLMLSKRAD